MSMQVINLKFGYCFRIIMLSTRFIRKVDRVLRMENNMVHYSGKKNGLMMTLKL